MVTLWLGDLPDNCRIDGWGQLDCDLDFSGVGSPLQRSPRRANKRGYSDRLFQKSPENEIGGTQLQEVEEQLWQSGAESFPQRSGSRTMS